LNFNKKYLGIFLLALNANKKQQKTAKIILLWNMYL